MSNDISDIAGTVQATVRKFRRSREDRMVAGVCAGAAKLFGVDVAIVRAILLAATVLGFGTGALVYLVCWIVVPEEEPAS